MANVARVPDLWAERLRRYVQDGGGLIVFLGDRVNPASYNAALGEALLPCILERRTEPAEDVGIRRLDESHPVFRSVAAHIDTERARVAQFFNATPAADAAVLAELERGPLLLERKAGAGLVLLFTTSADMDWINLPARPFFLPMLHQMVYYAGRPARRRDSVTVGMPYVLELPRADGPVEVAFYGPGDAGEPVSVQPAEPGDGRVVFEDTRRPGIYRAAYTVGGQEQSRLFAVNVEPRESRLERIEPEEAGRMLGAGFAKVVRDPEQLALVVRRERRGLPLWDYLFAMAIVLAVTESYVGHAWLKH